MNFVASYKYVLNMFSMQDINAWNVWIMNQQILHDLHYQVVRC
jgi:hypothetical protein